jgi:hypothetical protein
VTRDELRNILEAMTLKDVQAYADRWNLRIRNKEKMGKDQLIKKILSMTENKVSDKG